MRHDLSKVLLLTPAGKRMRWTNWQRPGRLSEQTDIEPKDQGARYSGLGALLARLAGNSGTGLWSASLCSMPSSGCRRTIRGPAQRITTLILSRMSWL